MKDLIDFCREHKVGPIGKFMSTAVTTDYILSSHSAITTAMIGLISYAFVNMANTIESWLFFSFDI